MKIEKEMLRDDFHRDTYWSRIHFESDDGTKRSTVLFCASHEYLWDLFRARKFEEVQLNRWHESVIKKWEKVGDKVFKKAVHYDVYSNTNEGKVNGFDFLKNEIVP